VGAQVEKSTCASPSMTMIHPAAEWKEVGVVLHHFSRRSTIGT
jgi:hypothetical protein